MMNIASVSLAQPLETIADELGRSFGEYGFAVVRDHGIPQDLIDEAEAVIDRGRGVAVGDLVRRVHEVDPPQARTGDAGARAPAAVGEAVLSQSTLQDGVESALGHGPAQQEGVAAHRPDQADARQVALQRRRGAEIVAQIETLGVQAGVSKLDHRVMDLAGIGLALGGRDHVDGVGDHHRTAGAAGQVQQITCGVLRPIGGEVEPHGSGPALEDGAAQRISHGESPQVRQETKAKTGGCARANATLSGLAWRGAIGP